MPQRSDLLYLTPRPPIDGVALRATLAVAFVTGEAGGALARGIEAAEQLPTEFKPECYARDLFLGDLVKVCFAHGVAGIDDPISKSHFVRLLTSPPSRQTAEFRQDIFRELKENPTLRVALVGFYAKLVQLRTLLDSTGRVRRHDNTRRRIDTLGAVNDLVTFMQAPFAEAKSGLRRLSEFAARTSATPEFQQLKNFVEYDDRLATLDVRLRVGADGSVRGIHLVRLEENSKNVFYTSPVARFFARLRFMFRGYRVPMQGLLEHCLDEVFDGVISAALSLLALIGDVEFYLAGLHFVDVCEKRGLSACLPTLVEPGSGQKRRRHIDGLFNPLLFTQPIDVVPASLHVDDTLTTTVVTGPNSGGKTRFLQAVALTQLLGQCGLFVPAERAELPLASGLFVSLTHPVEADQREGRLGSELIRIRNMFEQLSPNSLVIVDELCSGTNPSEGQEIFLLVVSLLRELHPEAFVTTHFLEFTEKLQHGHAQLGLRFLQVGLDENHQPTYQFIPGVARTSLAQQTAKRLGVTRAELLSLIGQKRRSPSSTTEQRATEQRPKEQPPPQSESPLQQPERRF